MEKGIDNAFGNKIAIKILNCTIFQQAGVYCNVLHLIYVRYCFASIMPIQNTLTTYSYSYTAQMVATYLIVNGSHSSDTTKMTKHESSRKFVKAYNTAVLLSAFMPTHLVYKSFCISFQVVVIIEGQPIYRLIRKQSTCFPVNKRYKVTQRTQISQLLLLVMHQHDESVCVT